MKSVLVDMKMFFVVLVIFALSGFIETRDYPNYGKQGQTDREVNVQGSVNVKGVDCREGEILGTCCPPNCEATCYRPNVDSSSRGSQNRKGSSCIEKCVCRKPLVRGMDRKCVPVSQCPVKKTPLN